MKYTNITRSTFISRYVRYEYKSCNYTVGGMVIVTNKKTSIKKILIKKKYYKKGWLI